MSKKMAIPIDMEPNAEHCCNLMAFLLDEKKVPIKYSPILREYSLESLSSKNISQEILYCPWCGKHLPD